MFIVLVSKATAIIRNYVYSDIVVKQLLLSMIQTVCSQLKQSAMIMQRIPGIVTNIILITQY